MNSNTFHERLAKAKSVLLVRPDNLGDVVLFSGALERLRQASPRAKITICVKRFVSAYLELCPHIDDILIWEDVNSFLCLEYRERLRSFGRSNVGRLRSKDISSFVSLQYGGLIRNLTHPGVGRVLSSVGEVAFDVLMRSGLGYDAVLFPVRSPEWYHHLFVKAVSAPLKLGISGDISNQTLDEDRAATNFYTARFNVPAEERWQNEIRVHAQFLNFLGIATEVSDLWPRMWTDASDRLWAEREMGRIPTGDCIRVGVAAGANGPETKMYSADGIAEALSRIKDTKFSCVILGSATDLALSAKVEQSLDKWGNVTSTRNLAGRTSIRQLIECLKLCDLVLAIDSAPLHIATALRKPTVGIMGGGHFGRFYPWGDPEINRLAHKPMDCYFCNWRCPNGNAPCVRDISPSVIARELTHLVYKLKRS